MALTNRVNVEFNFENIISDFDIYIVSKESKNLERTNILDLLQERFKALSVLYTFGPNSYALFGKGSVSLDELRKCYSELYDDIRIRQVTLSDLYDIDFCAKYFYYKNRLLAQLLINSIKSPRNKDYAYNNLTGKLFYKTPDSIERWGDNKEIVRIKLLQISLDKGMYLNVDEKSFLRCNEPEKERKRKYVLDKKTKNFRRMLPSDKGLEVYVEGNYKKRGKRIKYLNINNFTGFTKCRLGVLYQFLEDVEHYLGKYIHLSLLSRDNVQLYEETQKLKPEITKKYMGKLLAQKGVNVVDMVQDAESHELIFILEKYLSSQYDISISYGELCENMYNIRIIHNEEFYEKNALDDPYDQNFGTTIIQHITIETLSTIKKKKELKDQIKCVSSICDKTVQELILKNDVREQNISIYDWSRLSYEKKWTFVKQEKIQDTKEVDGKTKKVRKNPEYEYYSVEIDVKGKMKFDYFRNEHPTYSPVFEDLIFQLRNYGNIEGFVFSDEGNIHAIVSSNEKTMPNISNIWKNLKETNDNALIPRDVLINAINAVTEMDPEKFGIYSQMVIDNLKKKEPFIKKKDLRSIIQISTKTGKAMNRILNEQFGIWIYSEIRDSDFDDVYCLRDIAGIQYFTETDDMNKNFFCYFVGPKRTGMNTSIPNASIIRKVFTLDGDNEFKELLPLMSIEFVRNGMYTVLPYPFKYLREYKAICNITKKLDK